MNQVMQSQSLTMNSREIAEMAGKRHGHVMRDIRAMCEQVDIDSAQFWGEYQDSTGRTLPCFELDRFHTEVLVTSYDIKRRRAAFIKRWYDLESVSTTLHLGKGTARINVPY